MGELDFARRGIGLMLFLKAARGDHSKNANLLLLGCRASRATKGPRVLGGTRRGGG